MHYTHICLIALTNDDNWLGVVKTLSIVLGDCRPNFIHSVQPVTSSFIGEIIIIIISFHLAHGFREMSKMNGWHSIFISLLSLRIYEFIGFNISRFIIIIRMIFLFSMALFICLITSNDLQVLLIAIQMENTLPWISYLPLFIYSSFDIHILGPRNVEMKRSLSM